MHKDGYQNIDNIDVSDILIQKMLDLYKGYDKMKCINYRVLAI